MKKMIALTTAALLSAGLATSAVAQMKSPDGKDGSSVGGSPSGAAKDMDKGTRKNDGGTTGMSNERGSGMSSGSGMNSGTTNEPSQGKGPSQGSMK